MTLDVRVLERRCEKRLSSLENHGDRVLKSVMRAKEYSRLYWLEMGPSSLKRVAELRMLFKEIELHLRLLEDAIINEKEYELERAIAEKEGIKNE